MAYLDAIAYPREGRVKQRMLTKMQWLAEVIAGTPFDEIAKREGLSVGSVRAHCDDAYRHSMGLRWREIRDWDRRENGDKCPEETFTWRRAALASKVPAVKGLEAQVGRPLTDAERVQAVAHYAANDAFLDPARLGDG